MKRRWRLWLPLLLVLLAGLSLLHPAVHWRLIGWSRGEIFYDNRPISWWVEDIEDHYVRVVAVEAIVQGGPPPDPGPHIPLDWVRTTPSPWWEWRPRWWHNTSTLVTNIADAPLVKTDPDALPLLLQLLRRPEVKSRQVAVTGLARLADDAHSGALEALESAANDPDPTVRRQIEHVLRQLRAGERTDRP
jgi:hypothetical protein